ncbi:MAG: type II toxin-antitoxin system RelE/ParE family toxin [Myxococcales bacterium]
MKSVRFEPEAREELLGAVDWYAERDSSLADRFIATVDGTLVEIGAAPHTFPLVVEVPRALNVRKRLLNRFPYAVVFTELDDEVRILAIAHVRRRPGYWRERV